MFQSFLHNLWFWSPTSKMANFHKGKLIRAIPIDEMKTTPKKNWSTVPRCWERYVAIEITGIESQEWKCKRETGWVTERHRSRHAEKCIVMCSILHVEYTVLNMLHTWRMIRHKTDWPVAWPSAQLAFSVSGLENNAAHKPTSDIAELAPKSIWAAR